jgi:hypothetical protein
MADFDNWETDGGDAESGGADGGAPVINGGLLDPRTFPSSWGRLASDGPSLDRPDPEITGPLRIDYGSEVLQDILTRLSSNAEGDE